MSVVRIGLMLLCICAAGLARAQAVGTAMMVIGSPIMQSGGSSIDLRKGSDVFTGSTIRTGSGGHVHLRFVDGTLVSVRPHSELAIVAYEGTDAAVAQFKLELTKGSARTVSGDGLKKSREKFRLNTPIAAIGIRGTDFTTVATSQETWVEVHSGEVVMAPFDELCRADGIGPCNTESAQSLSGGSKEILRLRIGATTPEILKLAAVDRDSNASIRNPREQLIESDGEQPNSAELAQVNRVDADEQVVPLNVEPKPFLDTDDDLRVQNGALVWGHWFSVPSGDTWSQPATQLIGGFDPTVSNSTYGLFRDPTHAGPLAPARTDVSLGLKAAEASYTEADVVSKARVNEGVLVLDFGNGSFVSKLSVQTDRAGTVGLEGAGVISPSGIFVSKSTSDRMAGAITKDGLEAGMLFEKKVGAGSLQGISLWGQ